MFKSLLLSRVLIDLGNFLTIPGKRKGCLRSFSEVYVVFVFNVFKWQNERMFSENLSTDDWQSGVRFLFVSYLQKHVSVARMLCKC